MDFVSPRLPNADSATLMRAGRIATIIFMVLAVAWAPQIERFESLWQYLQAVLAYAVPPVCALFLVGLFWRGANAKGALASIVSGLLGGAALFYANVLAPTPLDLDFLYVAPLLFAVSAIVLVALVAVSAASTPPSLQQVCALLWTPACCR